MLSRAKVDFNDPGYFGQLWGVTEVAFFDRTHHLRGMKNRLFQIQQVVVDQTPSDIS